MPTRLLVALTLVVAAGCGSGTDQPSPPTLVGDPVAKWDLAVTSTYPMVFDSGYVDRQRLIIQNSDDWAAAWAQIWGKHEPMPPLPPVDFSRQTVVLAAATAPTPPREIYLGPVARLGSRVQVLVTETVAGRNCVWASSGGSAVAAIALPFFMPSPPAVTLSDINSLEFVEFSKTVDCE